MTPEEHQTTHLALHQALDELVACFIELEHHRTRQSGKGLLESTTLLDFILWSAEQLSAMPTIEIVHNKGLLSFRKGNLTMEFDKATTRVPFETVGQWRFQFSADEKFVSESMPFMTALEYAELHARDRGYIFIRIEGP